MKFALRLSLLVLSLVLITPVAFMCAASIPVLLAVIPIAAAALLAFAPGIFLLAASFYALDNKTSIPGTAEYPRYQESA